MLCVREYLKETGLSFLVVPPIFSSIFLDTISAGVGAVVSLPC